MPDTPVYAAKMGQQFQLAERHGLRVITLTAADIPRLSEKFAALGDRWAVKQMLARFSGSRNHHVFHLPWNRLLGVGGWC